MDDKNRAAAGVDTPPENTSAGAGRVEEEQEESGWTDYLEDYNFSSEIEKESNNYLCSSSIGSCSWNYNISEANNYENINVVLSRFSSVEKVNLDVVPKKLTFKKTRTQKIFEDDSLEDTATSPIQSPKIADLELRTSRVNSKFNDRISIHNSMFADLELKTSWVNPKFDGRLTISNSMGKEKLLENFYSNAEKSVYSAAELKEKGLCLFPLSMLLNYNG